MSQDYWDGIVFATEEISRVLYEEGIVKKPRCKYCGSYRLRRYGRSKDTNIQRLQCYDCRRTFMETDALPGMKTPADQVASALNMYYEGMSLNAIRRHLKQMYNNYPSDSTVYEWIDRFTNQAVKQTKDYKPEVGDVWVADETVLKIGGKNVWFWDLIDVKTRYLLASHLSTSRTQYDARLLMHRAAMKAGKPPKRIITDQLAAYIEGVGWNFGKETIHTAAKKLTSSPGTQLIERFHSTLKARTKVTRGLKSTDSARRILQGWLVHYNYLRPHEALGDRTPAEKAGLKYPFKNWKHIVNLPDVKSSLVLGSVPARRALGIRAARTPKSAKIRQPKQRRTPKGDIYIRESRSGALLSRRPFRGAKAIRARRRGR